MGFYSVHSTEVSHAKIRKELTRGVDLFQQSLVLDSEKCILLLFKLNSGREGETLIIQLDWTREGRWLCRNCPSFLI